MRPILAEYASRFPVVSEASGGELSADAADGSLVDYQAFKDYQDSARRRKKIHWLPELETIFFGSKWLSRASSKTLKNLDFLWVNELILVQDKVSMI